MYSVSFENGQCCVALACDRKSCLERISVKAADQEAAQHELFRFGWRIHRGKQVCPLHASKLTAKAPRTLMPDSIGSESLRHSECLSCGHLPDAPDPPWKRWDSATCCACGRLFSLGTDTTARG